MLSQVRYYSIRSYGKEIWQPTTQQTITHHRLHMDINLERIKRFASNHKLPYFIIAHSVGFDDADQQQPPAAIHPPTATSNAIRLSHVTMLLLHDADNMVGVRIIRPRSNATALACNKIVVFRVCPQGVRLQMGPGGSGVRSYGRRMQSAEKCLYYYHHHR